MVAAGERHPKIVQALIEAGADLDAQDRKRPFRTDVRRRRKEPGIRPNPTGPPVPINP